MSTDGRLVPSNADPEAQMKGRASAVLANASRCFRCFSRKFTASYIPVLRRNPSLAFRRFDTRDNSETLAVFPLFFAVFRCFPQKNENRNTYISPECCSQCCGGIYIMEIAFCRSTNWRPPPRIGKSGLSSCSKMGVSVRVTISDLPYRREEP
jgi:hypothetical protein